jgi:hypothetical protein
MMIERVREHLRWDDAIGIVGLVAGALGATLVTIEHYIQATVCFSLSAVILALCSIVSKRRWTMRAVAFLLSMALIYLASSTDDYRIHKKKKY